MKHGSLESWCGVFLLLAVLGLSLGSSFAIDHAVVDADGNRLPLEEGVLPDVPAGAPVSTDAQAIVEVHTPRVPATDIWIAAKPPIGSAPGTGTREDPLDGGTQPKLERIFQSYHDAGINGVTFHFGPGSYHLIGALVHGLDNGKGPWALRPGWKIKGAGKNETTIIQDQPATGDIRQHLLAAWDYGEGDMSVEDLTLDLGYARFHRDHPHSAYAGIGLRGSNCYVRNVRILHAGGNGVDENFVIFLYTNTTTPVRSTRMARFP
ncbi:MAG TPA: hypothetical protein VK474_04170 [Chthoniobacterales bacterium]|nr:hypothetical protein [Chthoniobacterales bacterium]